MKRVVIKIGSSVMSSSGRIDEEFLEDIVRQVSVLCKKNIDVCLVSSGAIVAGLSVLGLGKIPSKMNKLQAVAAVGQAALMHIYNQHFKKYKKVCGQVLLTWDDFEDRSRYNNAKNTFLSLFDSGVVPVVNENDTVSTEEIKFGDNDELSALVAGMVDADLLLLLSNVDKFDMEGKPVDVISGVKQEHRKAVREKTLAHTRGGMLSKLNAADLASTLGIKTVIAHGRSTDIITRIILGNSNAGTHFLPRPKVCGKKRWMRLISYRSRG